MRTTTMSGRLHHVLVATDGSENGSRAVAFSLALAKRHGSELLFCYVVDHAGSLAEFSTPGGGLHMLRPVSEVIDDAANSILAEAAKRATDAGLVGLTTVLDGATVEAIVTCAKERHVDAIVIGTQGKRGLERLFMGSTAEGVLRRTEVPVFVVPPGVSNAEPAFDRMLVAVDDSDPSDAAVLFALDLAKADEAGLVFCSVVESNEFVDKAFTYGYDPTSTLEELRATAAALLSAQTDRAHAMNLPVESVVAEGEPAELILETAAAQHAGFIVVGTHGRRGLRRLIVGSVAESIVRRSPVPVVVIRALSSGSRHAAGTAAAFG